MESRGLYELKRHFQAEHYLTADQTFSAHHQHSMELFMLLKVPELNHKRPMYPELIEWRPFIFSSESSRVLMQIDLMMIFLNVRDQLWNLRGYWTQVTVLTGHSAGGVDSN